MKEKIINLFTDEALLQLIRYGLIGIIGLVVDFGVFSLFIHFFNLNAEIANFISSSCGLINNFLWNSYLNFKVKDKLLRRFIEYYIVGQVTTIITTISIFLFSTLLKQDQLLVKVISTLFATLIQFIVNKLITFRK